MKKKGFITTALGCKDFLIFSLFSAKKIALLLKLNGKHYPHQKEVEGSEDENKIDVSHSLSKFRGGQAVGNGYR
jgi:hypothetical protein